LNYAGKFDATFPSEGPGTHSHAYAHVDSSQTHAPAGAIIVPDAQLLFHADYSRSGTDLILSRDHHEYVVHDYFHGEKRAPLASREGAYLTADIVKALVGEVEVSQAGAAPVASQVIGHVTKLQGSATVIRNGVSIILNMGDNVEKGDVVESGASSTVGITFIDGTVFGLSSNARMVLNEMVYDPNGSSNSSLMSLVAGTITFVAGETAKHGDMKIDTPVATMGIRGTACLVEIDFSVPGQNGQPNASFQVLVEPDGTTGSYILFDKNTLQPIAIVNQAGQQININNGIINITTNPLSPDLQKLITDVFQQKFTDNSTNTKSTSPSTDSIIPTSSPLVIKTAEATITAQTVNVQGSSTSAPPTTPNSSTFHISGPPIVHIANLLGVETTQFRASGELPGLTGSPLPDAAVGIVSFNDINVGDQPSVSAAFGSFTYKNAHGQDVTGGLSALQLADIAATEVQLTITPLANNTNVGSAIFSYSIADQSFDFLAAGEQITFTYFITVNENYAPDPTAKITIPITITITGTNDVPVITTSAQSIAFAPSGTKTVGGDLKTTNPTSGTLAFTDVDLTDTHTVAAALTSAVMSNGGTVPPLPESVFEAALSAAIGIDSTGTGAGTINWQLSPLPVYLSDFIPPGQTLTLTYTITVTDSQGATSTQTVTVIITGNNDPAVVWIHTTTDGHDNLWTTANNWETGTVPTSSNDVIIITDQLHPNTPAYPVTIDATTSAAANSVTMNDFVNLPPELDVLQGGSLTIADALSMSADSILHNAGTVSVGGAIELLDSLDTNGNLLALNQSVIVNSGTLNLGQGGDFQGLASITNTGMIDLKGGILKVQVDIANSLTVAGKTIGGQITVENGATLALGTDTNKGGGNGGITGGTVTITIKGELDLQGSNFVDSGALDNSGNVFITGLGNAFDAETITNTGAIELKSGAALVIDQGSSVSGSGTITIDGTAALTLNDVTISGNTINDNSSTAIDVTGSSQIDTGATLNNGGATVEGGVTLTLDGIIVNGTTITDKGTVVLADTVTLEGGASIAGTSTSALGTITNNGTLEVAGPAFLTDDTLTNNSIIQIDSGETLTLSGTEIIGGTVNDNSSAGIDVTGSSQIDTGATLNNGGATVEGGVMLTLDGITVNATTITDKGTVVLADTVKLTGGATIQGPSSTTLGTITNNGELEVLAAASAFLTDVSLTNSASANTVQVDTGSTLTINASTIHNGQLNNSGLVQIETAGTTSTFDDVDVTNSGASANIQVDTGLGPPPPQPTTLVLANGTNVTNGKITIGQYGILNVSGALGATLDNVIVSDGNLISVAGASLLVLEGTSVTGTGTVTVSGELDNKSGSNAIDGAVTNTGTIDVEAGTTLDLAGGLLGGGTVDIDAGATLKLAGSDNETIKFTGGAGTSTLELDSTSVPFNGTITVNATAGGTFDVTGQGSITTASGNALDVNASGGTNLSTASVTLNLGGAITGAANGINVTQNGTGAVSVTTSATVKGLAGNGIEVTQNGIGDITVDATGQVIGTGTGSVGLLVQNSNATDNSSINVTSTGGASGAQFGIDVATQGNGDITVESDGTVSAPGQYGIRLRSFGTGSETLTTDSNSDVTSGSSGLVAVNRALAIDPSYDSTISVTAHGTINSGNIANISGTAPAGILAGYNGIGGTGTQANTNVTGTVIVDNYANITATSGEGIDAYNYGNGDITVTDEAGTTVSGVANGIAASAVSGGTGDVTVSILAKASVTATGATSHGVIAQNTATGDVTVNDGAGTTITGGAEGIAALGETGDVSVTVAANATVKATGASSHAILANGAGNVSVSTSASDLIQSNASGIAAYNLAGSLAAGTTVSVTARGTIKSGTDLNPNSSTAGGIEAGYLPNVNSAVDGNVAGNVIIDSYATIMAAAGYGIDGYNWGTGNVTITAESTSSITATGTADNFYGTGIGAFANDGGSVSVTQDEGATDTGVYGLWASATGLGTIAITNHGDIYGQGGDGILVTQASGTGSTTITNSGTVTGTTSDTTAVVVVHENTTGLATIDNSGTIGAALVQGTWQVAIYEDGGNVSIDNTGTINGAFNVANGTFTNETDGTWNAAGTSGFGTASGTAFTIDNAGTINLSDGASLSAAHGLTITDSGTIDGVSGTDAIHGATIEITGTGVLESTGGTLTIDAQSQITNDTGGMAEASGGGTLNINGAIDNAGTITASGGTVNIAGAVTDTGYATIANSGTLHFESSVAAAQTITFQDATGTLAVSDPTDFHATIASFGAGDKIDLTGVTQTAGEYDVWTQGADGGTLSIYSNGTLEAQLNLSGSYTQGDFALASDGNGGTDIVWSKAQAATISGLDNAGNPVDGYSATANLNDSNAASITYTWLENGHVVQSSGSASFTASSPLEVGQTVDVVIGFTDNGISERVTEQITALAGTVAAAPAVTFGATSPVTTTENAPLTLQNLSASFADAGNDTITATLSVTDGTLRIGSGNDVASITLTGTLAQINDTLKNGVTYTPNDAFAGNDSLSFSLSDPTSGHTFTASGALTVTVNPVAPTLTVSSQALDVAEAHNIALNISETPFDPNDNVSITISNVPADATLSAGTNQGGGVWTLTPGQLSGLTFNAGDTSSNLVVTATNTDGSTATSTPQSIEVDVIPPPQLSPASTVAFHEHATVQLGLTDTDATNGTVTVSGLPDDLTGFNGVGTYTPGTGGNPGTWTGTAAQFSTLSFTTGVAGTFDLTVSATNSVAETTTQDYVLTVDVDHWKGASADWSVGTDWSYGSAPGSNIDAVADASGTYVVTITGADVANSLTITAAGAGIQDNSGGSLTLNGALTIDAGSFSLTGGSLSAASIYVGASGQLIAEGTISAPINNDGGIVKALGTLSLSGVLTDGGALEIDSTLQLTGGARVQGLSSTQLGTITNLGLLEILGAATLLDVTVTNTNHNIRVDGSQTLGFDNSTITSGTLTVNGEFDSTGTSFINGATIINQNNIHVVSGSLTIDPTPVTNTGTIEAMAGTTLVIDADTITNSSGGKKGTVEVDGNATLDLQGSEIDGGNINVSGKLYSTGNSVIHGATIINNGLIDIAGGNLTIDSTSVLSGTGGFKMEGGGSLTLNGALVGNLEISGASTAELGSSSPTAYLSTTVTFDIGSTGTLKLDYAEDFSGKVIGFATGQTLDLADISYASTPIVVYTGNASGGVLAVYVNGQDVANIDLTGNYTGVQWVLSSDGQNGTDIKESTEGVLAATLDHPAAQQGVTMHVTKVTDGSKTVTSGLTYAWQMSIDGKSWTTVGTGSSFTPGEAQEGHLMQLVVAYTDALGTQDVVYNLGMPNDLAITVDQTTAQEGLPIHVTSVTDGGTAVSSGVSYLWETSSDNGHTWTAVGHSSSYTPSFTSDGGKLLQLVVSYSDPGESESVTESFGTVALAKEWTGGSHTWETSQSWNPAGAPASTDNAVVDASGHYTVTVDQTAAAAHSLVENASQATVEIVHGGMLTLGGNLVIDQGNLQVDSGGTLKDIATSATITGSFTNNGTVEAGGGKLEIANAVTGSGIFKIDAAATLQLDHASSENVTFSNAGTLVLEDPTHFSGTVSDSSGNLTNTDVLDLAGFDTKASVNYIGTKAGGVVLVSEAGKLATIDVGANTTNWTKPVSDGNGGILIKDPVQNDAAPNVNTSHAWSTAGADSFVFKSNPGANAVLDADHSPVWPEPDHPDSAGKLAQFLQNHDAAGLPTMPGLQDTVTPDSLKTQLLSHHNEFHFV
jgi:hypothetical protein